jgi:hypothetical protein
VFVYFDNDQKSAAPQDAARLIELVEGKTKKPARTLWRPGCGALALASR